MEEAEQNMTKTKYEVELYPRLNKSESVMIESNNLVELMAKLVISASKQKDICTPYSDNTPKISKIWMDCCELYSISIDGKQKVEIVNNEEASVVFCSYLLINFLEKE